MAVLPLLSLAGFVIMLRALRGRDSGLLVYTTTALLVCVLYAAAMVTWWRLVR